MTDPHQTAMGILTELQDAVAAKDLDRLSQLFADDVVLFGTAAANVDREQTVAYLALAIAQDGIIRWTWDRLSVLVSAPGLLTFAVLGTVGFEDSLGLPVDERSPYRLTCVVIEEEGRWRLRHFHGSVPERV